MRFEIEECIRKNLIIHLSSKCCKCCYKPFSDKTIVEIDDLAFIFAEKLFYRFDCSVAYNKTTIKHSVRYIHSNITKRTVSLLKPSLHGDILRFAITCNNCNDTNYLEYNMSKIDGFINKPL